MNRVTFYPSLYQVAPAFRTATPKTEKEVVFRPAYDVVESTEHFELQLALPGVNKEDVSINVEKNQLVVEGTREAALAEGFQRNHQGIAQGNFRRIFNLPDTVNSESIDATMEAGILSIRLPKLEKAQKRTIAIA